MTEAIKGTVTIDVLVEDSAHHPHLRGEHGLSLLVTTDKGRVLFDAGQSDLFLDNATRLGIPMTDVHDVVLSHGHYDHGGGIPALAQHNGHCTVFAHPEAFYRKFERSGHTERDIGIPWQGIAGVELSTAEGPRNVAYGLISTGVIDRVDPSDQHLVGLTTGPDGDAPDPLLDEQALIVPTPSGAIVLVGCAHAGLRNTIATVRRLVSAMPLRALIGGFHMLHMPDERLASNVACLASMEVGLWGPCHCTGRRAQVDMLRMVPGRVQCLATGDRLTFEEG